MTNIYFVMYNFRIRRKHTPKLEENYLTFDEIINEDLNLTFRDIIKDIFLENTFINDNLRVTNQLDFDDENGTYSGLLDLGEYGNLRKVFNREDDGWEDEIDENKIVCDPFLFRFDLPHNLTEGFLVLEKKKSKPFTTTFFNSIEAKIKDDFNNCISVDRVHVIPLEAEPLFNNSDVLEFIFIKNEEDPEAFGDNQVIVSKRKLVWDVKNNNLNLNQVKEENYVNTLKQHMPNFEIFAKTKWQDGKISTVNLEDIYENKMFYLDITEELDWENGNPQYERIKNLAEHYSSTNFYHDERNVFEND